MEDKDPPKRRAKSNQINGAFLAQIKGIYLDQTRSVEE